MEGQTGVACNVKQEMNSSDEINMENNLSERAVACDIKQEMNSSDEINTENNLSKRAQKKLLRKQKWEMNKMTMRQNERQKRKLKRVLQRENGELSGKPSRKLLKSAISNSKCTQRVAIDIGFNDFMCDRDIMKTCSQIQRCYALNRRSKSPLKLFITSCAGKTRDKLFSQIGTTHWDVNFRTEGYMEEFAKEDIVYLTSESDCVLEKLEDSKVYIIGGLVDHNKHKGLCHAQALKNEIKHARLPIDEFINMKTRKVLTINHVFEILLRVLEGLSWQEAFMSTIAPRKGAIPKDDAKCDSPDDGCVKDEQVNVTTS